MTRTNRKKLLDCTYCGNFATGRDHVIPNWTTEELEELSGSLLQSVKYKQSQKKLLNARIEYAKEISKLEHLSPSEVWENEE